MKEWEQIEAIFHAAADLPFEEQNSFLQTRCSGDDELYTYLERLLAQDRTSDDNILSVDVQSLASLLLEDDDSHLGFGQLGPYQLIRKLGHGGMGVVYLARRADVGNEVAIKVLRDILPSSRAQKQFAAEQKMLAQLIHPSIARFYDALTLPDGRSFFVLEYVDGIPLTRYCREHNLALLERLQLFSQTCEAVQYLHGHAIIHRDLKPSNILVKADGTIRLLDFGIAKSLADPTDSGLLTHSVFQPMTPAYAAPEQISARNVGTFTDVYALGVILYELLTEELPYDISQLTPAEAERALLEMSPLKPSDVLEASTLRRIASRATWSDLDVICMAAMHKDVSRRYQSAEALLRDLQHLLHGEPVEARADSLSYRMGKFLFRNARSLTAAAAVLFLVTGIVLYFAVHLREARDAALAEASREERIQEFMLHLLQGDRTTSPAVGLQVSTLLDRGSMQVQTLTPDPTLQADLYGTLGRMYAQMGRLDRAALSLKSSLRIHRAQGDRSIRSVVVDSVALGLVRADQGRLDEGRKLIEGAVALTESLKPSDANLRSRSLTALAMLQNRRGQYREAINTAKAAISTQKQAKADGELAASLSELSSAYFYEGRYSESEAASEQALAVNQKLQGTTYPAVADNLLSIASVQEMQGHLPDAENHYRKALQIFQNWYGSEHPETATVRTQLAQTLVLAGKYDEAVLLLKQALAAQEHIYGPVHPNVALALNALGMAESGRAHHRESAVYYKRALEMYRSVNGDYHYTVAVAMANWGSSYLNQKDYRTAESIFREAVRRLRAALPPNHINTAVAEIKLGRTLLREKRYQEASVESEAGLHMLMSQPSPPQSWLLAVRKDLAACYGAMGRDRSAEQLRSSQPSPLPAVFSAHR